MTKKVKDEWKPVRPGVTSDLVRVPGLVVVENGQYRHFKSYLEMMDWMIEQTFEIAVNSPEEYDALDAKERRKLDAVHDAWFPK